MGIFIYGFSRSMEIANDLNVSKTLRHYLGDRGELHDQQSPRKFQEMSQTDQKWQLKVFVFFMKETNPFAS